MSRLDRYLLLGFLAPFLFGVGTFLVILVGIELSPWMLRLLVRDGYPAGVVFKIFLLNLPKTMALSFPLATIFGSLMCMATLSTHGEIIAMRAGGLSFGRIALPVLIIGLVISVLCLGFNEIVVPGTQDVAYKLVDAYAKEAQPHKGFLFQIPAHGPAQRVVYANVFDPAQKRLEGLTVMEMKGGNFQTVYHADEAQWVGKTLVLKNAMRTVQTSRGQRTDELGTVRLDIGKSPADVSNLGKDLVDMSMAELHQRLAACLAAHDAADKKEAVQVRQTIDMRWAVPWAALGFALIGAPLGLRPARATTGIGLGLSLVVIFAYYIILNTVNLIGQQGNLDPLIAAWLPNLMLFVSGGSLFLQANR